VDRELERLTDPLKKNAAAPPGTIAAAEARLNHRFPPDYVEFLESSNGAEGWLEVSRPAGEPDYYLMLWPVEGVVNVNEIPEVKAASGDLVLFGSDGGSENYGFRRSETGSGIVQCPNVRNGASDDIPRGSSLLDFLRDLHARPGVPL